MEIVTDCVIGYTSCVHQIPQGFDCEGRLEVTLVLTTKVMDKRCQVAMRRKEANV